MRKDHAYATSAHASPSSSRPPDQAHAQEASCKDPLGKEGQPDGYQSVCCLGQD